MADPVTLAVKARQSRQNKLTGPARRKPVMPRYGRDSFRVWLGRPGKPWLRLDHMVEGFSWTENREDAIIVGSLTVRAGANQDRKLTILAGHRIKIEWAKNPNGKFMVLLMLRVYRPTRNARGDTGFELKSDLALLAASEDDWKFTRGKKHGKGWRANEITQEVCRRYGVKLGLLPVGKHRIKKKVYTDTDPLTVINDAWKAERTNTGRRFVISYRLDRLSINPLRRSTALLALGPQLIEASLQEEQAEEFATALTIRNTAADTTGEDTKGRRKVKHRKITVKVQSGPAVRRYGYVHRVVASLDAESAAEARALGLRYLAKKAKPVKSMTLTSPGIPTIRKGDSVKLDLTKMGYKQVVWVAEITHTVSPSDYTMDVGVTFDDPYVDEKKQRIVDNIESTALERGRESPGETKKDDPKPKGATDKEAAPGKTLGEQLAERGGL